MNQLRKRLETEGYRFNFFQAVRLLEMLHFDKPPVGHMGPFDQEAVRLRPSVDLRFSPSDVSRIEHIKEDETEYWNVIENFLGLYGPNSATPIFIAEMIAQCPSDEDALREFLDIFNHRILSLYYRAWKKYNLSASISPNLDDPVSKVLFALIGQDSETTDEGWAISPHALLRYSSYFSSSSRPASGLENLLSDYFELDDVTVIQFVPRKFTPTTRTHNQIGGSRNTARLGESFVLGDTITDIGGQFLVRISNLDMNQYLQFLPGEDAYKELVFLTELYTKHQLNFGIELVLKPKQGGPVTLSAKTPKGALGHASWMGRPTEKETRLVLDVKPAG